MELYAHIKRPCKLMQAAAWFFPRQSPGMKRHLEEAPPPLGYMLTDFAPCVPVRVMCGCVATACRRLVIVPAGMYGIYRTTGRWAAWIMERVTRGHVNRVQVWLQRRACCAVRALRLSFAVCLKRAAGNVGWFSGLFLCITLVAWSAPRRSFLCAGCCCLPHCTQTRYFGLRTTRFGRFGALPCDC